MHICFGYAAIIHERPSGYSFLPELADVPAVASYVALGHAVLPDRDELAARLDSDGMVRVGIHIAAPALSIARLPNPRSRLT